MADLQRLAAPRPSAFRIPLQAILPHLATTRWADPVVLLVCIALTAVAQPHLLAADTLISLDTATQYYPWYAYLGDSLRGGHMPGWNPATLSGTPFAANPLSGWTYVPAMLVFALLPLAPAVHVYLLFHAFLAAVGGYALARVLGLSRAGALLTSVAYANSGFFDVQNVRSNPFASVYAWLPVALIGVELALRANRWHARVACWGLAAFAMSQIIAVWPGQGAYYSAMLVGGYIAFRTFLCPLLVAWPRASWRATGSQLATFAVHSAAVFVLALALDAAAILPRLEFNSLSNLAGGYTGAEASVGGLNPREWLLVSVPGYWYAGLIVLALATVAVFLRPPALHPTIGYFGLTSVGALLISGRYETPLHWLLYHTLPGFAGIHPHAPERIMTVAYLGPALLAGAGLAALEQREWSLGRMKLGARARGVAPGLMVLLVVMDLAIGGAKARADVALTDSQNGADKLTSVDLMAYFEPDAAARFLQGQLQWSGTPSRYIGYAPYTHHGLWWPYTTRFMDPLTAMLEVNNRALSLGLQDAQGYDASHLQRYDMYFAVLNGQTQNYHDAEVFWAGLQSPLLDLLNVRYVVVPPVDQLDISDTLALRRFSTTVYSDKQVRILENPTALPRAWIVHSATQMRPAQALVAIDSGRVAARSTALLEEDPPTLAPPFDATSDRAEVTLDAPDRMVIATSTTASGLLMLSEVYYPAWRAYVDDQPTHVFVADGALRAIALPPGNHLVQFRFESLSLLIGSLISVASVVLLVTLAAVAVYADHRAPR